MAKPETVAVVPVPVLLTAPGFRVSVQFPEGKPLRGTLPVAVVQVGWIMVPIMGAADGAGAASIMALLEAAETQPSALVTVKV